MNTLFDFYRTICEKTQKKHFSVTEKCLSFYVIQKLYH